MNIEEKFVQLIDLGASNIIHLDGSLIDHLKGTYALLKQWNANAPFVLLVSIMLFMVPLDLTNRLSRKKIEM